MPQQNCQLIFIRESSGVSHQYEYNPNELISTLLSRIFQRSVSRKLKALSKGRLLDIQQTLAENNLKPNQIIHLLVLSRQEKEGGKIYLSFENKIYRIDFLMEESVRQLKKKIEKQTNIPSESQIILFNSIRLQDGKYLRDYELRDGDFVCMGELKPILPHILDINHVIFPKKGSLQKRRGSECVQKTQQFSPVLGSKDVLAFPRKGQTGLQLFFSNSNGLLSSSQQYGPSPLSEYDNQFKLCMEDWMKMQPEIISEQLVQEMNWTQTDSGCEKQQRKWKNFMELQDVLTPTLVLSPAIIGQKLVHCQSHYGSQHGGGPNQQISLFKKLQAKFDNGNNFYTQKIVPRFANSIEVASPSDLFQALNTKDKENDKKF